MFKNITLYILKRNIHEMITCNLSVLSKKSQRNKNTVYICACVFTVSMQVYMHICDCIHILTVHSHQSHKYSKLCVYPFLIQQDMCVGQSNNQCVTNSQYGFPTLQCLSLGNLAGVLMNIYSFLTSMLQRQTSVFRFFFWLVSFFMVCWWLVNWFGLVWCGLIAYM